MDNPVDVVLTFEKVGSTEWKKAWKEVEAELFRNRREDAVRAVKEHVIHVIGEDGLFGTFGIEEDVPDCDIMDMVMLWEHVTDFLVEKIELRLARNEERQSKARKELESLGL